MLDEFREQAASGFEIPDGTDEENAQKASPIQRALGGGRILGLNATQRFVLALLIFLMTVFASAGCLLLSGKVFL